MWTNGKIAGFTRPLGRAAARLEASPYPVPFACLNFLKHHRNGVKAGGRGAVHVEAVGVAVAEQ